MRHFTTLKAIKAAGACESVYKKLLNNLGKKRADSKPLTLEDIYNSNGLNDALWCVRLMPDVKPLAVQFAAACARRVLHIYEDKYPGDDRPRKAIDAAENNKCDAADAADAAAYAADAATYAADAAYAAAYAAYAADAADAAAYAAYAADAADAATYAAAAAYAYAYAADATAYAAYAAEKKAQNELFKQIFFNENNELLNGLI